MRPSSFVSIFLIVFKAIFSVSALMISMILGSFLSIFSLNSGLFEISISYSAFTTLIISSFSMKPLSSWSIEVKYLIANFSAKTRSVVLARAATSFSSQTIFGRGDCFSSLFSAGLTVDLTTAAFLVVGGVAFCSTLISSSA